MTAWIGLHVYYASNADPLLLQCVAPLVTRLRERRLLRRWFFIRYWVEGPHVRVRLLPIDEAAADEVRAIAHDEITAFLKRRPALYDASSSDSGDLYRQLYVAEYGEEAWQRDYGDAGMPFRPNNSLHEVPYEPEYDRYGGPAGIELAEWNFEASSDLVLRLLATTNTHVRSVLLGTAAQMTAALCFAFLSEPDRVAQFLVNYREFWQASFGEPQDAMRERFDATYTKIGPELREHLDRLRVGAADASGTRLTAVERGWVAHAHALRARVARLAEAGQLAFRRGPDTAPVVVDDPDAAFGVLLSSYVHMTNNRLGASILDETYLSYLLSRALRTESGAAA